MIYKNYINIDTNKNWKKRVIVYDNTTTRACEERARGRCAGSFGGRVVRIVSPVGAPFLVQDTVSNCGESSGAIASTRAGLCARREWNAARAFRNGTGERDDDAVVVVAMRKTRPGSVLVSRLAPYLQGSPLIRRIAPVPSPRGPAFVVSITHFLDAYLRAPRLDRPGPTSTRREQESEREKAQQSPRGSLTTLGDKSSSFGGGSLAIHRYPCPASRLHQTDRTVTPLIVRPPFIEPPARDNVAQVTLVDLRRILERTRTKPRFLIDRRSWNVTLVTMAIQMVRRGN